MPEAPSNAHSGTPSNAQSSAPSSPDSANPPAAAPVPADSNGQMQGEPGAVDPAQEQEVTAIEALEGQLAEAQARAAEFHDAFLRAKAEQENIRRRSQEDVAKAHKFAIEGFAESLVPVIDSLEAALATENASSETMRSGVELTLKQLQSAFEKANLSTLNPVGEKFDPNLHQAISMVPAPEGIAPNHVVTVLQKGYLIADRVLRPALVVVAQG